MFTEDWCGYLRELLQRHFVATSTSPLQQMNCVEIGSFEGRGSLIIIEALCKHSDSRLYCIDPWNDAYVLGRSEFNVWDPYFKGQYARFIENTKNEPKIIPLRGTSIAQIPVLENDSIDFAFIDGDHSPGQVYADGRDLLPKMKVGGHMLFDDYNWESGGLRCGDGIDRFIDEFGSQLEIIEKDSYMLLRKRGVTNSSEV